uniref:CaMBD domain-containing protein n=2 Tax=Onchocerca TaxID=6281 RepID=A0A8R1U0A6_ONCVO
MDHNEKHHISLSSLTSSRNDKKFNTRLSMDQSILHTTIIPRKTLQNFNSPSVVLSDFGPISSDPEIKSRPLSSSLSRISVSPCSVHRRIQQGISTMPIYGPDGRTLQKGATVTNSSPRNSTINEIGQLDKRYGRSCDFLTKSTVDEMRLFNNPFVQVSSDILRVSGYTNQFKSLLTSRSALRRESGSVALEQNLDDDEYRNGGIRFEAAVEEQDSKRKGSTVRLVRRRRSGYGIAISSDSTAKMRCRLRKQLFIKRNRICEISLAFGLAGLIFVIIDSEITATNVENDYNKTHPISILLRSLCVLCTIALMASLVHYHSIEVKMALIDSGADDWRVALTTERAIKLAIELIVCAICPVPGTGIMQWSYIHPDSRKATMVDVPVDVILSVPMFLRAYLFCRFMVLHSKQFQDAATRSIAALNRISMDFRFVIKTMMADHPLRVLIVFTVSFWICMSWMFTQCERYDGQLSAKHYYLNSIWFIIVTFMSVGYGDIVPNTYCGRTLAITTGIVGAGVSSALIAVISRKLELSRAEKHVNNFMADSKLTNQRKNAAALVLQQTWFIHKYKNSCCKTDELRLRQHQRRFLQAIYEFRRIKWDQRKLQERGNLLIDFGKLHNDMHETLWEMHRTQSQFITQMNLLTQKIMELQYTLKQQQHHHQQQQQQQQHQQQQQQQQISSQQQSYQAQMSNIENFEFDQSTLPNVSSSLLPSCSLQPIRSTETSTDTNDTDKPKSGDMQWVQSDNEYVKV